MMTILNFKKVLLLSSACSLLFASNAPVEKKNEFNYRSDLGHCPTRPAGMMALQVIKEFEDSNSLYDVKSKIIADKWMDKYFVTDYKLSYDPYSKVLKINFDCSEPIMKVQIYKNNGADSYEAILTENGQLVDPTYEALLRQEKKLTRSLPYLALPVNDMDNKIQAEVTSIVRDMRPELRKKLSEVIVNDNKELTIILSVSGNPSSVFMGLDEWREKMKKLDKIVSYMEAKEKIPAVINLTNGKKVVVKFKDKF
jgi:hypothetical protein